MLTIPMQNDYEKAAEQCRMNWVLRKKLVQQYSWSIPNASIIAAIRILPGPVVDMGAGTGYWASLIEKAGGQVQCYDLFLGLDNYYGHRCQYHPIEQRGVEVLRNDAKHCQTMLLAWPPYDSSFGFQCVRSFRGQYIVYVGEGEGGCCGCKEMFKRLASHWEMMEEIALQRWDAIYDYAWIYGRKGRAR